MKNKQRFESISFDGPAKYRIRVKGIPAFDWFDQFDLMTVKRHRIGGEDQVMELEGWMADQAALAGFLNSLYEMHLSLISIEILEND